MRRILFVHQNFPGQFLHLARDLARRGDWSVAAIGSATARPMQGVRLERYDVDPGPRPADPASTRFAIDSRRGEGAAAVALRLREEGFVPDVVVGHTGWGEMLYMRDVFPSARLVSYLEFYFTPTGADVNFDPEFPSPIADPVALSASLAGRNAAVLLSAATADTLVAPTRWQASRFPADIRGRIEVVHEGIDTRRLAPHEGVRLELPNGRFVQSGDEVLTYVARNLEPYRGFHRLMRALPEILRRRPQAQVLVIGGDEVSYGAPPPRRRTWRRAMLDEVGDRIDRERVHFLGRVPYDAYVGALQISRAHVYLTYPFVLSWSLLEAMSCGASIIASDTEPVRDAVRHGVEGRLVNFFDSAALVDAVTEALASPEATAPMRRRARERAVQQFDVGLGVSAYRKRLASERACTSSSVFVVSFHDD